MDPPYPLRLIDAHTDHTDGLSQSQEYPESWSPVVGIEPRLQALPPNISPWSYYTVPDLRLPNTSPESYYTASDLRQSNASSPQSNSYYSAVSSPSHSTTTNTDSTLSSNMSFPYSVTSINSRKSRMNVLYPRRAHPIPPPEPEPEPVPVLEPVPAPDLWPVPMPVPVPSEIFAMSHDVRCFSSYFFVTLSEYRYSCSPPRPESGSFVHLCCHTRRPVLYLREKFSSSRWGLENSRNLCLLRLTSKPATVPTYLLR